jgi:3-carboxy-cis,cis-muconate cycloisomerase
VQEHERGTHGWQVEWLSLPQMMMLTGGALKHAIYLGRNLQIDENAMRSNIARGHDLILAEAAVFTLARVMPRPEAEELVKKACAAALADNRPLIEALETLAGPGVKPGDIDWRELARAENYLGEAQNMTDAVLERARRLS